MFFFFESIVTLDSFSILVDFLYSCGFQINLDCIKTDTGGNTCPLATVKSCHSQHNVLFYNLHSNDFLFISLS